MSRAIRIGTRGSALALAQTALVAGRLTALGAEVEVVRIRTSGDRPRADGDLALDRGAFVAELERALLDGRIDLAVHSAKDLPTDILEGTRIAAVPPREDPRDALVGGALALLPSGATVGTGSPRRRAFLLRARPDLAVVPIAGNVDTRLARLDEGRVDALVLAAAGLVRLGLEGRIAERLAPDAMLPAVGQGALALQTRAGDPAEAAVRPLDDPGARAALAAERAFLAAMGGGCRAPYAALATVAGGRLAIDGAAIEADGRALVRAADEGPAAEAEGVGARLAETLLGRGAAALAEAAPA